ncbi:MAG: Cyclic di-GMP phosphodiesterase response regulator RpfG, partial [Pelotomaculum thermopropionicum]
GYPTGLKGTEIPEFARIIAIADHFDNLTADRDFYQEKEKEAAILELKRLSGVYFDPALVDIFTGIVDDVTDG